MLEKIKKHPIISAIGLLFLISIIWIASVWYVFNSGITNEWSSTIDRTNMEAAQEDVEAELQKLLNQ